MRWASFIRNSEVFPTNGIITTNPAGGSHFMGSFLPKEPQEPQEWSGALILWVGFANEAARSHFMGSEGAKQHPALATPLFTRINRTCPISRSLQN